MGGPLVASLMNNFQFFGRRRPDLRPSFAWVHFSDTKSIARTGVMFLILQIAGAIAYSSDNILIAQFLGASAVTSYAVPEKLFSLIGITLAMLLSPLWPAYGEAIARGDTAWVKKTLWRSLKISGLAAAALSTAMVLLGPWLLSIWIGHAVQPSLVLLLGLGVWKVLEAIGTATAAFLNGGRIVRLQTSFAVLTALAALAFKALAISWWSISAIPWAMSLAYVLLSLIPYAIFVPRVLK
jgi:O-antigen/teichoic acid export membrane protein